MIKEHILRLKGNIASICEKLGRDPESIKLVGITKFASTTEIQKAIDNGLTDIGENKVQEAHKKYPQLSDVQSKKIRRHMVGHLQSNKVRQALELFDLIQSVDSLKLLKEIQKQSQRLNKITDLLIQVNIAAEEQKFGFTEEETASVLQAGIDLKNVRICGLMTIAPLTDDQERVRECFRKLRNLRDTLIGDFGQTERLPMQYLSMGMTNDYEIAIEEGSNMVRVGRAIFK